MPARKRKGPTRPPDVVDYRDYRAFLKDAINYRRARDWQRGARYLARLVGLSDGHLGNIVAGRRDLAREMARDVGEALDLEGERLRFLVLLVELSTTAAPSARAALQRELDQIAARLRQPRRRGRPTLLEALTRKQERTRQLAQPERRRYVRVWLTNALFALLSCPEAPQEAPVIVRVLRRYTTPTAVLASVRDLHALGLLVEHEGRLLAATDVADASVPEAISTGAHLDAWEQARAALLSRDPDALLCVTPQRLPLDAVTPRMQRHVRAFYDAALACEQDSTAACVTIDHPTLPPYQEPARVVLQQAMMSVPFVPFASEPASTSTPPH